MKLTLLPRYFIKSEINNLNHKNTNSFLLKMYVANLVLDLDLYNLTYTGTQRVIFNLPLKWSISSQEKR